MSKLSQTSFEVIKYGNMCYGVLNSFLAFEWSIGRIGDDLREDTKYIELLR